jgi:hydrogenase expression/formation protein HypD
LPLQWYRDTHRREEVNMIHRPEIWIERIRQLALTAPLRIMNVCGGHERAITQAGLRGVLPPQIELIPGPGCPVCVCPEEDIYLAIQLALQRHAILVAFGDMLRVPVNVARGEVRSLDAAKGQGADVRPVASPLEVVAIARQHPDREVIFFAAGFETTMAPVAAWVLAGDADPLPPNLRLLLSGRLTWPAVAMLLDSSSAGFDALIAPGHVATVMGSEEWQFVNQKHAMPSAVAGFQPASLLAAIWSVARQRLAARPFLDNCYPELVKPEGNTAARQAIERAFAVVDAPWRGIGTIPASGYALRDRYRALDARIHHADLVVEGRRRAGEMPPGCDCAEVVLGRLRPTGCRLYGTACTPRQPVGPCMVSDEGACRIWWSAGARGREPQISAD